MSVVYVPSKDRPELAAKTWNQLDKYNSEDYDVYIVIEPQDVEQYESVGFDDMGMLVLPHNNKGIGYARRIIHEHATRSHFPHFVMCDDDLRVGSQFHTMVDFLQEHDEVLGCGAFFSNYGLMFGPREQIEEPFPVSGSLGYNLFALNTFNLEAVGGYEDQFTNYQEDTEICRLWIREQGIPWYVDPSVGASMGKRFGPGGLSSLPGDRMKKQERCHRIVFDRWGERYISEPPKKFRCSWKRLLQDYAPDYVPDIYPRSRS